MYDLIDRPVADLPVFEQEVLQDMRRWVHALTLAGAPPEAAKEPAFGAAMRALNDGSTDDLVIQRPCFPVVEETEAVLLGLWRLVRAGRLASARAAAEALVDPAHARVMVAAMTSVAA
jgi:hypothetical protein